MTIPRKGRRTVELSGERYGWYIRRKPTDRQAMAESEMHVAKEKLGVDKPCVLIVDVGVTRPDNGVEPHETGVKPAMVRAMITRALDEGWNPAGGGPVFELRNPIIKHVP